MLAVALNPNAPGDVLLRLAALAEARAALAERDLRHVPRLLEALLTDPDIETQEALAANPTTPWAIRRGFAEQSENPRVRACVIRTRLPTDRPEFDPELIQVLRSLAHDPDPSVRSAVARNPQTPVDITQSLARDPEPEVRKAVAGRHYRPELASAWRCLLADPDASIRAAAAGNPAHPPIPDDLADGLLLDPHTRELSLLNSRIPVSEGTAAALAADPDDFTRVCLAAHPLLPSALIGTLAADQSPSVRAAVATRDDITPAARSETIASLPGPEEGYDEDSGFALEVFFGIGRPEGGNRNLSSGSAETGRACLRSPYPPLRRVAARSAALPPESLAELFDDADHKVAAAAILRHPDPPGAALERLALHRHAWWWPGPRPLDHPAFPQDAWARFAVRDEPALRSAACRDPHLPPEIVARLARDTEPQVRAAAAKHPNLPEHCVAPLLADTGRWVAESMGESPALTVGWMRRLLDDAGH